MYFYIIFNILKGIFAIPLWFPLGSWYVYSAHCDHQYLHSTTLIFRMAEQTENEFQIHNNNVSIETLPMYTRLQLARFNGVDKSQLYVGIRGYIYDVSDNTKSYGPGKAYHKLVGKDLSRLLALNRLQLKLDEPDKDDKDVTNTWYTGDLTEKQISVLEKWVLFFKKRYRIVGVIVEHHNKKALDG